jgi:hypothetical protein
MTVKVQHLRNTSASTRPTSAALLDGEIALNLSAGTTGAYYKDSSSNIVKIGSAEVGGAAPNASPGSGGSTGNSTGEFWYDTGNSVLKVYNGSSFAVAGSTTVGTTSIDLGSSSTTLAGLTDVSSGLFTFTGSTSGDFKLQSSATSDSTTYTWPASDGSADQVLATNGSGVLTWSEARTNDITQGDSSVTVTDTGVDGNIAFTTDGTNAWNIGPSGHFIPAADATFNIGASGTEVNEIHAEQISGTLQTASQTNITGVGTLTTGTWNADVVAPLYGGTGVDGSSAGNGQLLIGNGTGYSLATLTGDQSITITNTSGGIEIDANIAAAAAASAAANAGVASFNSTDFTVDAAGFVQMAGTARTNSILADDANTAAPVAGQLVVSGDTGISTTASGNTIEIDLDDTAVTPGAVGAADTAATFTVDQQGRLTAAAGVAISILHGAVSDFDTGVQENTLDSLAVPVAAVAMNSQQITGLADPTNDQDAATKRYVDSVAEGLDVKASVAVATTGNITLSGAQTIDGEAVASGDRVLVKDQTDLSENGIYVAAAGAWARSADTDTWDKLVSAFVFVEQGTNNQDAGFVSTVDPSGTLGTTDVTWSQFSGAGSINAGDGLTKTGNQIDVVGTANRISVSADAVDIDAAYVGQTSITTLGTISTGTWNGDILGTAFGGSGADGSNVTASHALMAPNGGAGNVSYREILTTDIAPVTGGAFDAGTY